MTINITTVEANALIDSLVDSLDDGAGAAVIQIRTGTKPAGGPDVAATGTLLATLTFSDPAFGAAGSRTATANSITNDTSADATGTAAHARILDSNSLAKIDCDVGTSGSDINFNSVSFTAGDEVAITALTCTYPASS